jgi:PleD family two-component response regulator
MQKEPKRVLAVLNDLFFTVKLADAAKRAGLDLEFAKDAREVLEKAQRRPAIVVFDLNFEAVGPLALISALKAGADTKGISLIGYVSHVQGELKQQAHDAGCDMVLARSAFSQNIPQIFKRHSGNWGGIPQ